MSVSLETARQRIASMRSKDITFYGERGVLATGDTSCLNAWAMRSGWYVEYQSAPDAMIEANAFDDEHFAQFLSQH